MLKRLLFCHRYNKNDPYVDCRPIDFEVIRDPMYKYSKVASQRFFDEPVLAFLFGWFSISY
jgi:hypothetical protein